MSRRLEWQSVFDEVLLRGLVVEGILSTEKRAKLLVAAASVPPREGACDAAYWFGICPDVGRAAAHVLEERSVRHMTSRVIHIETTSKGDTTKFVTELQDGLKIETCIMRKGTTRTRSTVCVSCQVGCSMACKFCATGTLGLLGNLTSGEIIEQFVRANALEPIRNVVYMGMGEPLANYAAVISSIHQLCEQKVHHVAPHRITLSTVGFDPRLIEDLINDVPDVSLALSLHAPNQLIRDQIVPTSTKVPLHSLLKAAFQFVDYQRALSAKKGKRQMLFIEYCMLRNVNDSENCAKELAQLLKPWKDRAIINLIPYNPTDVSIDFEPPDQTAVWRFHHILKSDHGFQAFVRQEHGQEVEAACGQLAIKTLHKMDERPYDTDPSRGGQPCQGQSPCQPCQGQSPCQGESLPERLPEQLPDSQLSGSGRVPDSLEYMTPTEICEDVPLTRSPGLVKVAEFCPNLVEVLDKVGKAASEVVRLDVQEVRWGKWGVCAAAAISLAVGIRGIYRSRKCA